MSTSPIHLLLVLLTIGVTTSVQARVIDRVVAVVNDEVVTWTELEDAMLPDLRKIDGMEDPVAREGARATVLRVGLDDLIGQRLIAQEAAARKVVISIADVDRHLAQVKGRQGWDEEKFQIYLSSQGMSMADFRKKVREQLLRQRVVRRVVGKKLRLSDSDLQEYYKEKRTQASADYEVEAWHIVLRVDEDATPAEVAATRQRAIELRDRARAGEAFEALAKAYSDIGGVNGGSLGVISRGQLEPILDEAFFALEAGEIGGPVHSARFGFHVLKVGERRHLAPKPFEKVKSQLRRELMDKRLAEHLGRWVSELKQKAFIEIRL